MKVYKIPLHTYDAVIKNWKIASVGKDVEKLEDLYIADGLHFILCNLINVLN